MRYPAGYVVCRLFGYIISTRRPPGLKLKAGRQRNPYKISIEPLFTKTFRFSEYVPQKSTRLAFCTATVSGEKSRPTQTNIRQMSALLLRIPLRDCNEKQIRSFFLNSPGRQSAYPEFDTENKRTVSRFWNTLPFLFFSTGLIYGKGTLSPA